MRRLISRRLTAVNVVVALVVFAAIGGVAYAASATSFIGPHGNINACVPPSGGELNVWKPGHGCSGGRVGLAFPARAQNGAQGPAGPAGAVGATGASGPTGATGPVNPNATTVDGETVTKLSLRESTPGSGTSTQTLDAIDGLTILASCDSSGNASLAANGPASANSELTVAGYDSTGTPAFGSQTASLGPSSLAVLGPAGSGEATFTYANTAGQILTGTIGYQKANAFGGSFTGCAFFGTLTSG
jgi:hypothetical protein